MKCAYCGKEAEKLIKGKITFRSHDQRTGRAKLVTVEREYCSDACWGRDRDGTRGIGMIRARFQANEYDWRPVRWPIKHPYWCTGYGDGYSIIVAYADDEAEILLNWPEAKEIESEHAEEYVFTTRFAKPDWFKG